MRRGVAEAGRDHDERVVVGGVGPGAVLQDEVDQAGPGGGVRVVQQRERARVAVEALPLAAGGGDVLQEGVREGLLGRVPVVAAAVEPLGEPEQPLVAVGRRGCGPGALGVAALVPLAQRGGGAAACVPLGSTRRARPARRCARPGRGPPPRR
ncbi:hypothetical protein RB200_01275 [Streptomyces sp. PmtG]